MGIDDSKLRSLDMYVWRSDMIAALHKYAKHNRDCPMAYFPVGKHQESTCTCGLFEALSRAESISFSPHERDDTESANSLAADELVCCMCGHNFPHKHTPHEVNIYNTGIAAGRLVPESVVAAEQATWLAALDVQMLELVALMRGLEKPPRGDYHLRIADVITHVKELRAQLRMLAIDPPEVPLGWVIMPKTATPVMEQAADAYWNKLRFATFSRNPRTWLGLYDAMVEVAPTPPKRDDHDDVY